MIITVQEAIFFILNFSITEHMEQKTLQAFW